MNLPSILEVLDDSRMVNEARDLEMRERAKLKNSSRKIDQGPIFTNEEFIGDDAFTDAFSTDANIQKESLEHFGDLGSTRACSSLNSLEDLVPPQFSEEILEHKIGDFFKKAIPAMIDKNIFLEKSIDFNKNLNIRLANLYKSFQESPCLKDKFEKSEEMIVLEKQIKGVNHFNRERTPFYYNYKHIEKIDSLREKGRMFKELCESNDKLFVKANSIHEQFEEIVSEAREIIEPPDFINLSQEWTQAFGEREISASKIVSRGCQNLTSEISRQENYLSLESEQSSEKVNAISAARALISLVERVFKESFLSYWNSLRAKELKHKIVCFITSNDGSSEEDVEKAFIESNFTLFTAEYFMRLVCEFVEINREFEVSTNTFFNRDYVGWVNLNNSWDVLRKIRLNLRNPIMHPNKDWVGLSEYEKYSNFITGTDRFSSWFNTSRPGNFFFRMKGSPLLEGQLIAKGAL